MTREASGDVDRSTDCGWPPAAPGAAAGSCECAVVPALRLSCVATLRPRLERRGSRLAYASTAIAGSSLTSLKFLWCRRTHDGVGTPVVHSSLARGWCGPRALPALLAALGSWAP